MPAIPTLPGDIGGIPVPQDEVSQATWHWVHRSLPRYLAAHSIRAYCWGVAIAAREGWTFDAQILWTASLLHDRGLATLPRNTMCFEFEGAEAARRFLERQGMAAERADRAAVAIILHMQPGVTLDDDVEAVLLDRATGLDVRGVEIEAVEDVRDGVMRSLPRGDFDRRFLAAITREARQRPTCQSARLLHETGLAGWMDRSPWRIGSG